MDALDNSAIVFTGRNGNNYSHKINEGRDFSSVRINKYYRPARFIIANTNCGERSSCPSKAEKNRIQFLENELSHYRSMLDEMVRVKTEMLHRRLSILETCNSSLGENYHTMRKMYLDLLAEKKD